MEVASKVNHLARTSGEPVPSDKAEELHIDFYIDRRSSRKYRALRCAIVAYKSQSAICWPDRCVASAAGITCCVSFCIVRPVSFCAEYHPPGIIRCVSSAAYHPLRIIRLNAGTDPPSP